jgi:hypothetical protein
MNLLKFPRDDPPGVTAYLAFSFHSAALLLGSAPLPSLPMSTLTAASTSHLPVLIVGWVPIFREVRDKSIGGDLDIDDEGSEQRRFELMQSLHHDSVGYQPVCIWIGLAKKVMSLQANREHK